MIHIRTQQSDEALAYVGNRTDTSATILEITILVAVISLIGLMGVSGVGDVLRSQFRDSALSVQGRPTIGSSEGWGNKGGTPNRERGGGGFDW